MTHIPARGVALFLSISGTLGLIASPVRADCADHEQARLLPHPVVSGDFFGSAVAASANNIAIGAYADVDGGAVYFYERDDQGRWNRIQEINGPNGGPAQSRFGFSVALAHDWAIAGAFADDVNGTQSGSVSIYRKSVNRWVPSGRRIAPSDGNANDHFGYAVAMTSDMVLVGAPQASNRGAAYIFRKTGGAWRQLTKFIAADSGSAARFGHAVALTGDHALIGAPLDNPHGAGSGAVYLFERNINTWDRVAKFTNLNGAANEQFGVSVALSGVTALIGSDQDSDNGPQSGSAFLFQRIGGTWTQVARLVPSDGGLNQRFGAAVALNSTTAAIGASQDGASGYRAGSAYVFNKPESHWTQLAKLSPTDPGTEAFFGRTLAFSDSALVVGSTGQAGDRRNSGTGYVYDVGACCLPPTTTDCGDNPPKCVMTLASCCDELGGEFVGVGVPCSKKVIEVTHTAVEMSHKIVTVSACDRDGGEGRAPCTAGPMKIDPWVSASGMGTNCIHFGQQGGCSIPAGFFGPESDAFSGQACLRGVPLGEVQLPGFESPLDFGDADTLVRRPIDPFEDECEIPLGGEQRVAIVVERLHLQSCRPIMVTSRNGQTSDEWAVEVMVTGSSGQPGGTLLAQQKHCDGGTFSSSLTVCPHLLFRKISDPTQTRELDYCTACDAAGVTMEAEDAPWSADSNGNVALVSPICSTFHAGLEDAYPSFTCDCNLNGYRDVCEIRADPRIDCNSNGKLDICEEEYYDVNNFVNRLLDQSFSSWEFCLMDVNQDLKVDGGDIRGFTARVVIP